MSWEPAVLLAPSVATVVYNLVMLGVQFGALRWLWRKRLEQQADPCDAVAPGAAEPRSGTPAPWTLCLTAIVLAATGGSMLAVLLGGSPFGVVRLAAYAIFVHGPLLLIGLAAVLWMWGDGRPASVAGSAANGPPTDKPPADDPPGDDPSADDPLGNDPVANNPLGNDPTANDPLGNDPAANDPLGNDPAANDPLGNDPAANDSAATGAPSDSPPLSAPWRAEAARTATLHSKPSRPAGFMRRVCGRQRWLAALCCAAALGLIAAGVDAFFIEPQWLQVTRVEIASAKLTRRYRIVLVADLQTDRLTQYERRALLLAQQQQPDLILLAGDYTQVSWKEFDKLAGQLNALLGEVGLHAPLGVFAVRGNVDVFDWQKIFAGLPVTTVEQTQTLDIDGLRLSCLALGDSYRCDLRLLNSRPERFHIVLGHSPNFALGSIEADLLLAGHTHGGQVRLPLLGTIFANAAVPRRWAAGLTCLPGGRKLYVSRGIGMERGDSPRMRFLCRPELTVIELVPAMDATEQTRHTDEDSHPQQSTGGPQAARAVGICGQDGAGQRVGKRSNSGLPKQPADDLPEKFTRLIPLHTRLGKPQPGDWLWSHPEPGQTFRQYVSSKPVRPTAARRTIYVQPLGEFTAAQQRIVDLTTEFLSIFFDLPVRKLRSLTLDAIPAQARRVHPAWGDHQLLTGYLLYEVLKPKMPDDACAMIGLTAADLWPGEGWNFVFGEASLRDRVGVWSLYRNGEPEKGQTHFRLCLLRTIKTAAHELCHMFSMAHCTAFECLMCGSNHRAEADRRPLALCPHCLAKLCYATGADPEKRYEKLIDFCQRQGLKEQQEFYQRLLAALRQPQR